MTTLLYINASPRGDAAASTQAAAKFRAALPADIRVEQMDLFDAGLPEFSAALASAKQKFLMGQELNAAEQQEWQMVTQLVEQFVSADYYLFGVPMWNFNVPYKLKQYIDLITHPGLTFTRDEQGIRGLASGATTVIYSRGGDYSPKDGAPDPYDFQSPYLKAWLGLVGLGPVTEVLVQSTMAGPDALASAVQSAAAQLATAARQLGDG
jgi:FMN-dependent NADH-azoreductase